MHAHKHLPICLPTYTHNGYQLCFVDSIMHSMQMSMSAVLAHIIALALIIASTLLAVLCVTVQLDTQSRAMDTLAQVRHFLQYCLLVTL